MVFIIIPNHETLSLTLDPNTTTLHSLKLSLYHHTHIPIHHLHQLYLSQSHPLPSQNDAVLLSRLCVVLDGPVCFRNHFPQPALKAQMSGYEAKSATAFYIPFYTGLAVGKYLWLNSSEEEHDWVGCWVKRERS